MSTSLNSGGSRSPEVYRDTALSSTVVGVTASACDLTGWNVINTNTSDAYVKFYNGSSGTIVAGTTEPSKVLLIPASSTVYLEHNNDNPQYYFASGMSVNAVTGIADSDTTAPTTGLYCEIFFKTS